MPTIYSDYRFSLDSDVIKNLRDNLGFSAEVDVYRQFMEAAVERVAEKLIAAGFDPEAVLQAKKKTLHEP